MIMRMRFTAVTIALALVGAAYVGGQAWLERPAPLRPGRAAAGRPTLPRPASTARAFLGRADALGLTAGQRTQLVALDRAWSEETGEVTRAAEAARVGFERFAREAGGRGKSIDEVQRQSAEYRELSATLRETRQRHAAAARAVLSEAQRQRLARGPLASGDGGTR